MEVQGMVNLLFHNFESLDHMCQTVEDVYYNFTSIYKAMVNLLTRLREKYPRNISYYQLLREAILLITFCRSSLKRRILAGDCEKWIDQDLANLLADIELYLLNIVDGLNRDVIICWSTLHEDSDMIKRIHKAYFDPFPASCLLIKHDLMVEFLKDLGRLSSWEVRPATKDSLTVLRKYVKLLVDVNDFRMLFAVEMVAYQLATYSFCAEMFVSPWTKYGGEEYEKTVALYRFEVLKVLVSLPKGFSAPLMSDKLAIRYVKFVQSNLLELFKINGDTFKGQLMILHDELSFMVHLLITYTSEHNSEQEKLSSIRLDFQAFARNIGSFICSCPCPKIEEMSPGFVDLIEKADVIKDEIMKTICSMVIREAEGESVKKGQLGLLILLLQNLKELMDRKSGMSVTWKDHENLVLFIFYLIQNTKRDGDRSADDEFSPKTIQFDIALINHEELNEVMLSTQVFSFNMACRSLLRRYKNLPWWELYYMTTEPELVDFHIRILKSIVLSSSTTPLDFELLIPYGKCFQDILMEFLRSEAVDCALKVQFNNLHVGLSSLWRFLSSYKHEQEKLSHIKVGFQELMRSVGSVICRHYNNRVYSRTTTEQCITTELSNLVENMNLIIVESEEVLYLVHINTVRCESPKINQLGSLKLLLEKWKGFMECESDLIITWKDQFHMIHENLSLFQSFLTSNSTGDDSETQKLRSSTMEVVYVAEYLLTTFSVGICPVRCTSLWISDLTEHVEQTKAAIMEVNKKKSNMDQIQVSSQALPIPTFNDLVVGLDDMKVINIARKDRSQISAQPLTDVMVGFKGEMQLIRKGLLGHRKELDVISIIGMPGLGKTTLARVAYETINHFDVRAWCSVSQKYNKKDLFLTILGQLTDKIRSQEESELRADVHKALKSRRYFIVLDDVWEIDAFMVLKPYFPDDNNGSRVLLTSRRKQIGLEAKFHSDPIEPGILSDEDSWHLLERKVYREGKCPSGLCQIGKEIAQKCKGLPLAVIMMSGVLATGSHKRYFWEQVRGSLNSYLARYSESQLMAALELSYEYLPDCLKPLFLYLGVFPEDKEISVDNLMRLWTAEGFVQNTESSRLEIQAEANLIDLIDRSLVMVARRRWDGRVKACYVHDVLRDMCLAKAEETKFMQQVYVHRGLPDPVMYQQRLSILLERDDETMSRHFAAYKDLSKFSIVPPIYSLLFFSIGPKDLRLKGKGDAFSNLKLLKVLDAKIFKITQEVLDNDLITLVHLKYMRFSGLNLKHIPSSISRLQSLETLIVKNHITLGRFDYSDMDILVPETIWEMKKLRHVHIDGSKFSDAPENPNILENLETLSGIVLDIMKKESIMKKLPSLKKLSCTLTYMPNYQLPDLASLGKLESLRVSGTGLPIHVKLPRSLKKLILSKGYLKWSEISIFQTLPNLQVLKLDNTAVVDEAWDMGDDVVFTNLKLLRLENLNIVSWNASSINFPSLEKLVLIYCKRLEEMPSSLEEFYTLQEIEVISDHRHPIVKVAEEIKREQKERNESLKINIHTW